MSQPKELVWNEEACDFFMSRITSHHGDVIEGIDFFKKYVICLNNGGQIRYIRNEKNILIANMTEFENILLEEPDEDEKKEYYYVMDFIKLHQK